MKFFVYDTQRHDGGPALPPKVYNLDFYNQLSRKFNVLI